MRDPDREKSFAGGDTCGRRVPSWRHRQGLFFLPIPSPPFPGESLDSFWIRRCRRASPCPSWGRRRESEGVGVRCSGSWCLSVVFVSVAAISVELPCLAILWSGTWPTMSACLSAGRRPRSWAGGEMVLLHGSNLVAVRCVHMLPQRWQTSIVTYMSFPGQLVASPPCSSSCRLSPCWFYCGQGPGYFLDVPDATRRGVRLASAGVLVATCCS